MREAHLHSKFGSKRPRETNPLYIYISKEQFCGNTIAQYRKRIS